MSSEQIRQSNQGTGPDPEAPQLPEEFQSHRHPYSLSHDELEQLTHHTTDSVRVADQPATKSSLRKQQQAEKQSSGENLAKAKSGSGSGQADSAHLLGDDPSAARK
ncbi:hypothetical protein H9P43_009915 [Blastocladiella emersonii ATCC 22665]|nr:hypothetical protein H9P43_009915 [Blastocladiella emersonii ATCC 22665]